jgi:hypothetical protein
MVENWNKENRNMRNKRVDSIQMSLFKHLQASNAMSTEFLQINAESELQLREMQRAFKFSESEREMCWMRIYLSIIGLIVGLVAIIFIIYKGYKYIKK